MSDSDKQETQHPERLSQKIGWFSRQEFVLLEDKLSCRIYGLGRSDEFTIPFKEIAPDMVRVKRRPWAWYLARVPLLIAMAFCLYLEAHARPRDAGTGFFLSLVLGALLLVCLVQSMKRTLDVFYFNSARGNIALHVNSPTSQEVVAFVRQIHDRSTFARSIEIKLTRALLQSLHAEGFLDRWQFERATERYCRNDDTMGLS